MCNLVCFCSDDFQCHVAGGKLWTLLPHGTRHETGQLQPPEPRARQEDVESEVIHSLPEASVRVAAEVPSPTSGSGIVREFEETCSQKTCVSRPSSVTRTRSGSVDVRQEFGTQGRILEFWGHDIRSGIVEVALRRGVIDAQNSRTVLSSHRFQCRKHGHIRDTVTADCGWEKRPTPDHQRQQDTIWIPHLMTSLWCVRTSEETLFRGDRTPHIVQRHFWMVWRKILQFGTVRS